MTTPEEPAGLDRRSLLRRSAVVGGALAWSTPLVQTIASPAFAAGSPLCETRYEADNCQYTYVASVDCCDCVDSYPGLSRQEALERCAADGLCEEERPAVCGEQEEDDEGGGDDDSIEPEVPTVIPAGS